MSMMLIGKVSLVTRRYTLLAGIALLVVALAGVAGFMAVRLLRGGEAQPDKQPAVVASTPVSGLATVKAGDLPKEAKATLALIDKGGPFPYDKDGTTFANAEKLLPKRPNGYYREYTVVTPGSRDRGARRLIAGRDGDVYYTDDHYGSFRQVLR